MQLDGTEEGGERLCTSFWLSDDADLIFYVELYGDGCSPEASSLSLKAVLPDLVASLA